MPNVNQSCDTHTPGRAEEHCTVPADYYVAVKQTYSSSTPLKKAQEEEIFLIE